MYIQDFFLKYYDYRPFKSILLNKVIGNASKIGVLLGRYFIPIWFNLFPGKVKKNHVCKGLIVCLTSFPQRINTVWLVVECLLRQEIAPEHIVLYLSESQFPSKRYLPDKLLEQERRGLLDIRLEPDDYRSHKKYWYAINDFPNANIVTVDDDIIYGSKMLQSLIEASKQCPHTIPCRFASRIKWNKDGTILPHSKWYGSVDKLEKGTQVFFGSGGGTLFPVNSLADANQPIEDIRNCCPMADDIWLNAIVRKNGFVPLCVCVPTGCPEWYIKNNSKLCDINDGQRKNDVQLTNTIHYFEQKFGINPFEKRQHESTT